MKINEHEIKYFNFETITSTNDFAKELLANNRYVVVTALNQIKGRGRNTNQWFGSYGNNLYISIGMQHYKEVSTLTLAVLQAVGSLAVKKTLNELIQKDIFKLKYPNDVYALHNHTYKKISGILVEHSFAGSNCLSSIIGIGLNINETNFPPEIADQATSLKLLGFDFQVNYIQNNLVENFLQLINNLDEREIFELWKNELNLQNKQIFVISKNKNYTFNRLLEDGRMELIDEKNNKITIDNGDSVRYNLD